MYVGEISDHYGIREISDLLRLEYSGAAEQEIYTLLGIYTEQRRSPLKLALAFSTLTSSLSEALRIFSRPPAPLLLGGLG